MIRKNIKFILIFVFLLNFPNFSVSIEPDIFVQSTVNRASQTLSKNISKEEKMIELQELAKDKFLRSKLGEKGRKLAKNVFEKEKILSQIQKDILELVKN